MHQKEFRKDFGEIDPLFLGKKYKKRLKGLDNSRVRNSLQGSLQNGLTAAL